MNAQLTLQKGGETLKYYRPPLRAYQPDLQAEVKYAPR